MGGLADIPTGLYTGLPGSNFAAPVTITLAAAAVYVLPAGCYYLYAVGADIELEVVTNATSPTWTAVLGKGKGGLVYSDGTNARITNTHAPTSSQTAKLIKIG